MLPPSPCETEIACEESAREVPNIITRYIAQIQWGHETFMSPGAILHLLLCPRVTPPQSLLRQVDNAEVLLACAETVGMCLQPAQRLPSCPRAVRLPAPAVVAHSTLGVQLQCPSWGEGTVRSREMCRQKNSALEVELFWLQLT